MFTALKLAAKGAWSWVARTTSKKAAIAGATGGLAVGGAVGTTGGYVAGATSSTFNRYLLIGGAVGVIYLLSKGGGFTFKN